MLSSPGQKLGGRCALDPCLHALITRKQGCARLPARVACSSQLVATEVRPGLAIPRQISVISSAAIRPLHAACGQSHLHVPTFCWGAPTATQSTGQRRIMITPAVHQQSALASRCISISPSRGSSQSRPWRSLLVRANMADTLVKETTGEVAQDSPLSAKPTTPTISASDDSITTAPSNPSTSSLPQDTAEISEASQAAFPVPLQSTEPEVATDSASDTPLLIQSLPVLIETISTIPASLPDYTTETSDIPQTNPSIPPQSAEPVAAFDGAPLLIQSLPVLTQTTTPAPSPEPAIPTLPIIDIPLMSPTPIASEPAISLTTTDTIAPEDLITLTDPLSIAPTAVQETEIASIEPPLKTIQLDLTNTMTPPSELPLEESIPAIDLVQPLPSLSVSSLPPSSDSSHHLQAPSSISSGHPANSEADSAVVLLDNQRAPTPEFSSIPSLFTERRSLSESPTLPLPSNIKTLTIELEHSIPTISSPPMHSTICTVPAQETHTTSPESSTPHEIDAISMSTSSSISDAENISPPVNVSPRIAVLPPPPPAFSQPGVEFPSSPLAASLPLPSENLEISFTPLFTKETSSAVLPEVEIVSSVRPEVETTSSSPLLTTAPPSLNSTFLEEAPSDVPPPPAIDPAVSNVPPTQSLAPSTPSLLPSEIQTPNSNSVPSPLPPYDSTPDQVPSEISSVAEETAQAPQSDVETSSPSFLDRATPSPDPSLDQIPSDFPPAVAIAPVVLDATPNLSLLEASAPIPHAKEETASLPVAPFKTSSTASTISISEEATSSPSLSSPTTSLDASPNRPPSYISPPLEAPPISDASPLLSTVDSTTSLSIPKVDSSPPSTPSKASATPDPAPEALAPLSSYQVATTPGPDSEAAPSPVMVIASLPLPPAETQVLEKTALNTPPVPCPLKETAPVIWLDTQTIPSPRSLPAASSLAEQQLIPELISPPTLVPELDTSVAAISQLAADSSLSTIAPPETQTPSTKPSQDAITTSTLTSIAAEVMDSPPILPLLPDATTSSLIPEADPASIPFLKPPPPRPEPFLQQATTETPPATEIPSLDVTAETPGSDSPPPTLAASELPSSDPILHEQAPSDIAPTPPSLLEETALSNQTTPDLSSPPSPPPTPEQPPLSEPLNLTSETLKLLKADDSISAADTTLSSPPVPEATIAPTESSSPSEQDTFIIPTAAANTSTEAITTAGESPLILEEVQSLPSPETDTLLPSSETPIHQAASDTPPPPSPVEESAQVCLLLSSSLTPPPPCPKQQPLPETATISESPAPETPAIALKELLDLSQAHRITAVVDPEVDDSSGSTDVASIQQSSLIPLPRDSDRDTSDKGRSPPLTPRAPVMVTAQVTDVESSLLAAADPTLGPHLFPALFLSMAVAASFFSLSSWNAKQGMVELVLDEKDRFNKEILARCPLLNSHYDPIPLLTGRHTSTIFAAFFRSLPDVSFRRDCLRMPDGGTVALDWPANGSDWEPFQNKTLPADAPLLILLPGLTGGSDDTYVRHLLIRARKHGWKTVVFNSRGCANSPVTTPQFYSASFTEDLREVVKYVASLHPSSRLYAAGWSLGANILVRYLGQEKRETPLAAAVSLCNPFDLVEADKEFQIGFNNVYNRNLAKGLNRIFKKHASLFEGLPPPYNIELVANATTVREFDDGLTRVSFGYPTVDHYYSDASSAKSIPNVAIPLLCVQAEDDPIAPSVGIPREAIAENGNVVLVVTPGGGHLGWVAGDDAPFGAPWTDPLVIQYLEAIEAMAASMPPGFEVAHEDAGKAQVVETTTHDTKGDGNGSVREGDKSVPISW